jgi:hypothetical protein
MLNLGGIGEYEAMDDYDELEDPEDKDETTTTSGPLFTSSPVTPLNGFTLSIKFPTANPGASPTFKTPKTPAPTMEITLHSHKSEIPVKTTSWDDCDTRVCDERGHSNEECTSAKKLCSLYSTFDWSTVSAVAPSPLTQATESSCGYSTSQAGSETTSWHGCIWNDCYSRNYQSTECDSFSTRCFLFSSTLPTPTPTPCAYKILDCDTLEQCHRGRCIHMQYMCKD